MESIILSTTYYPNLKEVFKHLDEEALVNCYNVSQDFRYFAKERLNHLNKIEWKKYSKIYNLSEDFIGGFKDKINREFVSKYQILSENFIRDFQARVVWYFISKYQSLSGDFIREFKEEIDWEFL